MIWGGLSDGEAVEERDCGSGEKSSVNPKISLLVPEVIDSADQVAVLVAYSFLSYISLTAHNAWVRENTVSQT